jgi:hypothetical protein
LTFFPLCYRSSCCVGPHPLLDFSTASYPPSPPCPSTRKSPVHLTTTSPASFAPPIHPMKRKTSTVTLLPFGPHQHQLQHSLAWSSQRSTTRSRLPSVLGVSVPCIMSAPTPSQLFEVSRRPNQLRIRPSIISEASSCDTSSSSSSSSSSSFPSTSPTSCSNSSPSLPPSPPPYVHFY